MIEQICTSPTLLGRPAGEDDQDRLPAGVSPEPWIIGKGRAPASEMEKRIKQVLLTTAAIEPTTSRGVGYRLLNLGLIAGKEQFVRVVELVRNLRDDGTMPFGWITDEGRPLWLPENYRNAGNFITQQAAGFYLNAWAKAEVQVVICVEKLALHGVFLPVAMEYDVPICATRGFNSITKLNEIREHMVKDKRKIIVINLGDHDASGIVVMLSTHRTLRRYVKRPMTSHRIAVLPEHIAQFRLLTRMVEDDQSPHAWHGRHVEQALDGRDIVYVEHGREVGRDRNAIANERPVYDASLGLVDLDAINPNDARDMLRDFLRQYLPDDKLAVVRRRQRREQAEIKKLADNWPAVRRFLRTLP
jgi:hypothetical protein